jgi:hypothetical protein
LLLLLMLRPCALLPTVALVEAPLRLSLSPLPLPLLSSLLEPAAVLLAAPRGGVDEADEAAELADSGGEADCDEGCEGDSKDEAVKADAEIVVVYESEESLRLAPLCCPP